MNFYLDARETKLKDVLEHDHLHVKQLDIGDFQANYEGSTLLIIERKTVADLVQSIIDGRYHEQKSRLLAFRNENKHVKLAYIIEGNYSFEPAFRVRSLSNSALHSSIINSMFRDGIFVIFTKHISETCEFLSACIERMSKDPQKYLGGDCGFPTVHVDVVCKTKKKDYVDKKSCLVMQLCAIPGISEKKANDIIDHFSVTNIKDLCNIASCESLIAVKGIGQKLATTIVDFLT